MPLHCRTAVVCVALFCAGAGVRAQVPTLTEQVGTASAVQTATVTFVTGGTLNAINVLTRGAPNLDFNFVTGGSCVTGTAYLAGQTCTVDFTFTPTHPGLRYGGISLTSTVGGTIANAYIYGLGTGPQVIYSP